MEKEKRNNSLVKNKIRFHKTLSFKILVIGILAMLLLIPRFMILSITNERKNSSDIACREVMSKWSKDQTINGPIFLIPVQKKIYNEKKDEYSVVSQIATYLPKKLEITGDIVPKKLNRSIYEILVYESSLNIKGYFDNIDINELTNKGYTILWDEAQLQLGITDLRGISKNLTLNWNEKQITFSPGIIPSAIGNKGVSIAANKIGKDNLNGTFHLTMSLKGSKSLMFTPLGEITNVSLESTCKNPGFIGNFLPKDRHVGKEGFTAQWNILHFNRSYPQKWLQNESTVNSISSSKFGVEMISIANHYQKNTRSAKYAILIILITFIAFFIYEVFSKQDIHPFQYTMVGSAIVIFYLLLLSISEHIGFNNAYLIAAFSVIVLIFLYSQTFMVTIKNSAGIAFALTGCYTFIFVLLQLESYALLAGSIGLFALLALLMYSTRNINWSKQ